MKKNLAGFMLIVLLFVAAITLGGLGNIAKHEHFYWLAFIANVATYGYGAYKLYKKCNEKDE